MPVTEQTPFNESTANGVATVFPYTFKLLTETDLKVYKDGVLQTSGYTVSGVGDAGGGNVTFSTAPANGVVVLLKRAMPLSRATDYQDGGDLLASTLDDDLDRIWQKLQQFGQDIKRALKLPFSTSTDQEITANAAARANKAAIFDGSGNLTTSTDDYEDQLVNVTAQADAAATSASAAAASASNASTSATNAATSASAASTSATAAASSATAAATSKTNAASSATAAATSATAAQTAETNAAGSATAASASASAAATSATAAAGSATSASNSASAAATSEAAAAASYDSFDDRYLGPKAADPTLDNDGNALLEGALYWNTTSKAMLVYDGAAWDAAYIPTAGYATDAELTAAIAAHEAAADPHPGYLTPAEGNAAYQPLDADLTAIAALTTTAFGRSVLDRADAAALRTLAGTVIGTDVDAFAATVSQAEAEAGTGTSVRNFTPQRVAQAIAALGTSGFPAAVSDTQTFTASGTWTKPATSKYVLVRLWGGGGSGAKGASNAPGGGGGGGAFVEKMFLASALGATETVTIGAGGAAQTTASTAGNAGGNSTFGTWLTAYGGGAGGYDATGGGGGGGGGGGAAGASGAAGTAGNGGVDATGKNVSRWMFADNTVPVGATATADALTIFSDVLQLSAAGGDGGSTTTTSPGGASTYGGGGGGCGVDVAGANSNPGGASTWGGGGGGGAALSGTPGAGGASTNGGAGGAGAIDANVGAAGAQPGGGGGGTEGGDSGAGGAGKCVVYCW